MVDTKVSPVRQVELVVLQFLGASKKVYELIDKANVGEVNDIKEEILKKGSDFMRSYNNLLSVTKKEDIMNKKIYHEFLNEVINIKLKVKQ